MAEITASQLRSACNNEIALIQAGVFDKFSKAFVKKLGLKVVRLVINSKTFKLALRKLGEMDAQQIMDLVKTAGFELLKATNTLKITGDGFEFHVEFGQYGKVKVKYSDRGTGNKAITMDLDIREPKTQKEKQAAADPKAAPPAPNEDVILMPSGQPMVLEAHGLYGSDFCIRAATTDSMVRMFENIKKRTNDWAVRDKLARLSNDLLGTDWRSIDQATAIKICEDFARAVKSGQFTSDELHELEDTFYRLAR